MPFCAATYIPREGPTIQEEISASTPSSSNAANPQRSPKVLKTQAKIPPSSQPSTVAISAAQSATGINHNKPPNNKKKTKLKPEVANVGYSETAITMDAVIAKNPSKVICLAAGAIAVVAIRVLLKYL